MTRHNILEEEQDNSAITSCLGRVYLAPVTLVVVQYPIFAKLFCSTRFSYFEFFSRFFYHSFGPHRNVAFFNRRSLKLLLLQLLHIFTDFRTSAPLPCCVINRAPHCAPFLLFIQQKRKTKQAYRYGSKFCKIV